MSTLPLPPAVGSQFTLGAFAARIKDEWREPIKGYPETVYNKTNDGLESIWMACMLATLSKFTRGPITQLFPANSTSVNIVAIPDPTVAPTVGQTPGGTLPGRTEYYAYSYVTDSGSMTLPSPLATNVLSANNVPTLTPPPQVAEAIGYVVMGGTLANGLDLAIQSVAVEPFGIQWVGPQTGLVAYPQAPPPPSQNDTADNIFAIERIEVNNVNMTTTGWFQSNQASSLWRRMGKIMAGTATSWTPYAYDFIDNNQVQFRPAPGFDLNGELLYVVRPRRLRFPNSRMPFTWLSYQGCLVEFVKASLALDLYEYESHDRRYAKAKEMLQAVVLQVAGANFWRDDTVTPFMRG